MTSAEIDARLNELQDLLDLTTALGEARGALLNDAQILGRCLVLRSVERSPTGSGRVVARAFSSSAHHVGAELSAVLRGVPFRLVDRRHGVLVAVTLDDGRLADLLPAGTWATVVVEFLDGLPEALQTKGDEPVYFGDGALLRLRGAE